MSSFLATAKARTARTTRPLPRPRLTVVPKMAARAPRVPFVALVVLVLGAGLVGLLLLNTSLQRGAYTVTDLRSTSSDLALRQQNLELRVSALESPHRISRAALRQGMVANTSPAFLSLSTGRTVGRPVPGRPGNRPVLGTAPEPVAAVPVHSGKPRPVAAGEGVGGSTGVQIVAAAPRHGADPATAGSPDESQPGDGARNSRDTGPASGPRQASRDTTGSGH